MKKSLPFHELSDHICQGKNCMKRIKQRIVDKHPDAALCYTCEQKRRKSMGQGHRNLNRLSKMNRRKLDAKSNM